MNTAACWAGSLRGCTGFEDAQLERIFPGAKLRDFALV